jgi:hypothetical protein
MKEEKAESQPSSIGAIGINGISDPGLKGIRLDIPKQETLEKTAVEWLKMQLEIRSGIKEITVDSKTFEELCEQAKEMEKQQKHKSIDKQVGILKDTLEEMMTSFDSEEDRLDFILDICNGYRKRINL